MSSNGKIVLNVLNWTWSSLAHYLQSFTSELFKKLLQMYLKKRRKVLEVAKVERMGDNKHDGLCMSDNFFYSRMTPHWNLCEQRQDNWQEKENLKENPQPASTTTPCTVSSNSWGYVSRYSLEHIESKSAIFKSYIVEQRVISYSTACVIALCNAAFCYLLPLHRQYCKKLLFAQQCKD